MREDWRKEFDERFGVFTDGEYAGIIPFSEQYSAEDFKSFIASVLTTRTEQAVAEERRATIEECEKVVPEVAEEPSLDPYRYGHKDGWNTCRTATLTALSNLRTSALQDPRRGGEKAHE